MKMGVARRVNILLLLGLAATATACARPEKTSDASDSGVDVRDHDSGTEPNGEGTDRTESTVDSNGGTNPIDGGDFSTTVQATNNGETSSESATNDTTVAVTDDTEATETEGNDPSDSGSSDTTNGETYACPARIIAEDGAHTFDLDLTPWVKVSGNLTANGEPISDTESYWRGLVTFEDTFGNQFIHIIRETGATYELTLPMGIYQVDFTPDTTCDDVSPFMPCSSGYVINDVEVFADRQLDIELPAVHLAGTITLNGKALPSVPTGRGHLTFKESGTDHSEGRGVALGTSGGVAFRKSLLPGIYDIMYKVDGSGDEPGCELSVMPCTSGPIATNVDLTKSQVLLIDIKTVELTGGVTLDGQSLPDDGASRGKIRLTPSDDALFRTTVVSDVGDDTSGSYRFNVLPGVYNLSYFGEDQGCRHVENPTIPCIGGLIESGLDLSATSTFDVDLHGVTVSGAVTLNSGPYDAPGGALRLINPEGDILETPDLGAEGSLGAAPYSLRVMAGTYDVAYRAPLVPCASENANPKLPCNRGVLAKSVEMNADLDLNLDVPLATISGELTLNGQAFPDSASGRPPLYFVPPGAPFDLDFLAQTQSFEATGPATYALTLLPGEYEVWWITQGDCSQGASAFPCTGGYITSLSLAESQPFDVDMTAVTISGQITQGGGALPEGHSGVAAITPLDGPWAVETQVAASEEGRFDALLIPGRYKLRGLGALPCELEESTPGNCGYYASAECMVVEATGEAPSLRPAALPSELPDELPTVDEPDSGAPTGPDGASLVQACDAGLGRAVECTAGTAEESGYATYRASFCDPGMAPRYEACENGEQVLTKAEQCRTSECDAAPSCATSLIAHLALCMQ